MKKILSFILVAALLFSASPLMLGISVSADTVGYYTYETVGDNAIITGVASNISGDVQIPAELQGHTVIEIGSGAFYNCKNVTSVAIPKNVTVIGNTAFAYCENLKKVTIYGAVETIGDGAFTDCVNLTEIALPESVKTIGKLAFSNCDKIEVINIPDKVINIGEYAFGDCDTLQQATLGKSVSAVSEYMFLNCKNLENVVINGDIDTIGESAFFGCEKLLKFNVPSKVKVINNSTFENCKALNSITLPAGITNIKSYAFEGCTGLSDVYYNGVQSQADAISIADYNECLTNAQWHYKKCVSHEYTNACDAICNICGEVRTVGDHQYSNACDTTCNICGYKRNITHNTEGAAWVTTATSHWKVCTVCGEKVEESNHTYDDANDAFCNICGYIRAIKEFPDVAADAWFYEPVNYVVGKGIMKGYGGTDLFGTANNLQREEFILMLARYEGVDLDKYEAQESKFSDVPEGAWFEGAINWGAEKGIITGYGNSGVFGVGDTITREQLVLMLYRYAEKVAGKDVTVGADAATNAANRFVDFGGVSDWATDAVLWAVENGVITGAGAEKNLINPQGNAQRCEIAQIMYNIYKNAVL